MSNDPSEAQSTRSSDGRQITWMEYGDPSGTPLISLHGTPGSKLTGQHSDQLYRELGLRVLSPDRAGYGESDPSPGRTVASYASDVVAVLDAADIERAIVFGGSGGGPHALAVGALAADRVHVVGVLVGAVVLEPSELTGQVAFNQKVFSLLDDEPALRAHVTEGRRIALTEGIAALLSDASEADKAMLEEHRERFRVATEDALGQGIEGMVDDYLAIWHRPWGFEAADVQRQVRWAHGRDDQNVPIIAARRYAVGLPNCDFEEWDGGHLAGPDKMIGFFRSLADDG